MSELYLAALLYFTNKFGDTEVREARQRLFKWAYSLRTRHQRVQFVTVNNHASTVGDGMSAFVIDQECPVAHRSSSACCRGQRLRPGLRAREGPPESAERVGGLMAPQQLQAKLFSVGDLFAEVHTSYEIPIYQRNYAWGVEQIEQLIDDVWTAAQDNAGNYFLGNLIVARRSLPPDVQEHRL